MTLRELKWAADGRLRSQWEQTSYIVAKIHNSHYTEAIQPYEIGPYALKKKERKISVDELANMLEGIPGVKVTKGKKAVAEG